MRTIWNGSINFGLVNIPVGLALATKPAARQSDVSFRTLHRECGTPIKQKRWCPVHDREVPNDELVKGWEIAKGEFVFVEDADLEAIMVQGDALALETLFVAEDVRSQAEIEEAVAEADVKDAELELARQVIDSLAGDFDAAELESEYRADLRSMLESKLAGEEVKRPEPVAEETPVIDLMEALRQSVSEAQKQGKPTAKPKASRTGGTRKRAA